MTHDEALYRVLSDVCPGRKYAWQTGQDIPPLPWFTYTPRRGSEMYADEGLYAVLPKYQVELFLKENDPDTVARFRDALSSIGTFAVYDDGYLESEGCIHITFDFSLQPHKERAIYGY